MIKRNSILAFLLLSVAAISISAQAKADQKLIEKFAAKFEEKLKNKSVGYQFYITAAGLTPIGRAGGSARRAPDPNPRPMTVDDRINIASVSKTITAAAVLKLLTEKSINVDTPVYTYLPEGWKLGANVKTITFRNLLQHSSGIRCTTDVDYAGLKKCIADGVSLDNKRAIVYNNSNFGFFRLIIPALEGFKSDVATDERLALAYSRQYMLYVVRNIFRAAGMGGIECKPAAKDPTLSYQFPEPKIAGTEFGDTSNVCGSQGWNMSSKQLATFMDVLFNTERILPAAVSQQMRDERLGLFRDRQTNPAVFSHEHTGHYPGRNGDQPWNPGELNSMIINFANGVNLAVIVNSQFGPGQNLPMTAKETMKEVLAVN